MKMRILVTLLAVAIGHQTYADYGIRVFIEPSSIKIGNQTPPVDPTDPETPENPESEINNFSVNKNKFTIGETAIFNWSVSNSTALILQPYGTVNNNSTGQSVLLSSIGGFDYTLRSTSSDGSFKTSNTLNVSVYGEPNINSFTVNGLKNITVEEGDELSFEFDQSNGEEIRINSNIINGNNWTINAPSNNQNYTLEVKNGADKTVNDQVTVNIVQPLSIDSFNAPSNVFINEPFSLNWTGSNVSSYELTTPSGVENLNTGTSKTITPTTIGVQNYTLKATNTANKTKESQKQVTVEELPTFTTFTVNGQSNVTVSAGDALTYASTGNSAQSTLIGRNIDNTSDITNPTIAPSVGTYTYYAAVTKTLNDITRYSELKSVNVTVVAAPTVSAITGPTNTWPATAFSLSWSGTSVSNYKIKSNNVNSGVSTSDVDLNTSTSYSITPSSAGTYTYTITATNAANETTTKTITVVVEELPSINTLTATPTSVATNGTTTLAWTTTNAGTLTIDQSVGTVTGNSITVNVGGTSGTKVYTLSTSKTLNGVSKNASRSVTVTITAPEFVYSASPKTYVWCQQIGWSGGGTGMGQPIVRADAYWQGTLVYTQTLMNACAVSPNSNFAGTDGGSYTTGPLQSNASGLLYQIRKN